MNKIQQFLGKDISNSLLCDIFNETLEKIQTLSSVCDVKLELSLTSGKTHISIYMDCDNTASVISVSHEDRLKAMEDICNQFLTWYNS